MIGRRMPYYVKRGIGGIDANTVLMLHGEDFTDASLTPKTINNSGAAIVSGGKFGKCFKTIGEASSYITIPISQTLSDFTVDYWMNATSWPSDSDAAVGGASIPTFARYRTDSCMKLVNPKIQWLEFGTTSLLATGTWNHIAVTRASNVVRGFVNGNKFAEGSYSDSVLLSGFCIGRQTLEVASGYFNGLIDEIRISDIARWTSNFTPPTQPYDEG